jgi:SAM-dependent methyltransferase
MPTIAENQQAWKTYDWKQRGDEWSTVWGGTEAMWWVTVFPRIRRFVPCGTLLEIAPGFGRWTHYLRSLSQELTGVDLSERCVAACRERFAGDPRLRFVQNDGTSLEAIPDESVDFVFSFDSLVHVEADALQAYVSQLARKLRPNGAGFLHHSNLGSYRNPRTGELEAPSSHWRAESVGAADFVAYCEEAGLVCLSQETLAWAASVHNDCFSTFTRRGSVLERPFVRWENPDFMSEAARAAEIARLYDPAGAGDRAVPPPPPAGGGLRARSRGLWNRIRQLPR